MWFYYWIYFGCNFVHLRAFCLMIAMSTNRPKSIVFSFLSFKGFLLEATYTLSRRGQLKLVSQEYEYTKVRYSPNTLITTWRCALPHSFPHFKCDAKAFTKKFGSTQMMKIVGEHSHTPNQQVELRQRKKAPTVEIPPFKMME